MKVCLKCSVAKPNEAFRKNKSKADGLQNWCRACKKTHDHHYYKGSPTRRARVRVTNARARQEQKRKVLEYFASHPCVDCGEADPVVLDFDHVRGVKKANVSDMLRKRMAWSRIQVEIAKCEIRCANCHRRKTARNGEYTKKPLQLNG